MASSAFPLALCMLLLPGTALLQWELADPWAQASCISNQQAVPMKSMGLLMHRKRIPRCWKWWIQTFFSLGCTIKNFSVNNCSHPGTQTTALPSLFALFAPRSELRLEYLCVILLLSCPSPLNNCFWQLLNYIWKDIFWARSSWASSTASSIFLLTCVLFHPFIFNRQLGAFFFLIK